MCFVETQMERPTNREPLAKRLQIGKSLGTGAYATVYRAVLDGQPCALKVSARGPAVLTLPPKLWKG